jgi:hypothetical protein
MRSYSLLTTCIFRQSQSTHHYRISNRTTPSTKRHINSLPPELLCPIFAYYCDLEYGPLPLLLVCRLWYAIASNFPTLWADICWFPSNSFHLYLRQETRRQLRGVPMSCLELTSLQQAVKRAKAAPLSLYISDIDSLGFNYSQILDMSIVIRCRELSFHFKGGEESVLPFLENLPLLECLELDAYERSLTDRLLSGIETGSPLLWSLTMRGHTSYRRLKYFPSLLRRIRRLDIELPSSYRFTDGLVMELQNLTELM